MRLAILAAVAALGCSGGGRGPATAKRDAPAVAPELGATRWIPSTPTYALGARSLRDAQRALGDVVDSFGMFADADRSDVSTALRGLLGVDLLSPDAVAELGVDVDGGFVVFSEAVNPTFVVRVADPAQLQAFLDQQRASGMATESVVVDGAEVFTTKAGGVRIRWAVADDWLWLHFALPFVSDDGTRWFTASRRPGAPAWAGDWTWAERTAGGKPALTGFFDLKTILATVSARIPAAIACTKLFEPVGRAAVTFDGDARRAHGRLSIDLGPAAAGVTRAIRPAPEGWAAVSARAPLAGQWNLDLDVVRAWAAPCLTALDADLSWLEQYGIRTARVLLQSLDPRGKAGTGAISADLSHRRLVDLWLDQIPLRSTLESKRTFGPYAGRTLSIPFGPSLDYVITDQLGMAAMGEGLLARVVGSGAAAAAPNLALAIDLSPQGLTEDAWRFLFDLIGAPSRTAARLAKWRDAHARLTIEGTRLVLEATGNRR